MLRVVSRRVRSGARVTRRTTPASGLTISPSRTLSSSSITRDASTSTSASPNASSPPTKWTRPLEAGVLPVYDGALAYIRRDSEAKKTLVEKAKKDGLDAAEVEKLEISSEINLPEVRWAFENGLSEQF